MPFPHDTETLELDLDSGIHMRAYARGGGPRSVLFLHGFPELALSWQHQLAAVPDGFRFIAADMRGYGGTDSPRRVRDYSMRKLIGDVLALARALKLDRFDLVGHDWGGAIGWEIGRHAPRYLRTLTVMNCPPGEMFAHAVRTNWDQLRRSWYMFFFQLPVVPERVLKGDPERRVIAGFRNIAVNKAIFTREFVQPYVDEVRNGSLAGINYYRAALRKVLEYSRPPLIEVPTRLIWGLGDGALGPWFADASKYTHIAKNFDIVPIAESGHWVQQEAPALVNKALFEHLTRN